MSKNDAKTELTPEMAVECIKTYLNGTKEHSRYMSWVHCYNAFAPYIKNEKKPDNDTIDYLALHLGFYLASWGMYRGSSFLLHKDYKIHTKVVSIIMNYKGLAGISAENLRKKENLDLLEKISGEIRKAYSNEKENHNVTDTLVTKILLGTLGCVPAYDRYYVQAVKHYGVSKGGYNPDSVKKIAEYYIKLQQTQEFEEIRQEQHLRGIDYPPMKLMDMCMWQAGNELFEKDKEKSNFNNIETLAL
jgi:hypothetical protein